MGHLGEKFRDPAVRVVVLVEVARQLGLALAPRPLSDRSSISGDLYYRSISRSRRRRWLPCARQGFGPTNLKMARPIKPASPSVPSSRLAASAWSEAVFLTTSPRGELTDATGESDWESGAAPALVPRQVRGCAQAGAALTIRIR